ncbi:methylated-DNA--[protein]-cysteine S-methyltransferase [Aliikangiella sp. IMCC44359]|uniref:methylated-DNA--[protein]-cysteine S-methyltransferase n=1 Tax=Aliikangiella sp. IMCC44359 TaxID=3459125 RepID=UPI00403A9872
MTNATNYTAVYESPVGLIGIVSDENYLYKTTFLAIQDYSGEKKAPTNTIAHSTCQQLDTYFKGNLTQFDLPLHIDGTNFRKKIWQIMLDIPYGQTKSYGQIAKEINSSPRAVGAACGHNHLPVIIPCHRIIGSQGLGGFAHFVEGKAINMKHWLLKHEGALAKEDAIQQSLFD